MAQLSNGLSITCGTAAPGAVATAGLNPIELHVCADHAVGPTRIRVLVLSAAPLLPDGKAEPTISVAAKTEVKLLETTEIVVWTDGAQRRCYVIPEVALHGAPKQVRIELESVRDAATNVDALLYWSFQHSYGEYPLDVLFLMDLVQSELDDAEFRQRLEASDGSFLLGARIAAFSALLDTSASPDPLILFEETEGSRRTSMLRQFVADLRPVCIRALRAKIAAARKCRVQSGPKWSPDFMHFCEASLQEGGESNRQCVRDICHAWAINSPTSQKAAASPIVAGAPTVPPAPDAYPPKGRAAGDSLDPRNSIGHRARQGRGESRLSSRISKHRWHLKMCGIWYILIEPLV